MGKSLSLENKLVLYTAEPCDLGLVYSFVDEYYGQNLFAHRQVNCELMKKTLKTLVETGNVLIGRIGKDTIGAMAGRIMPCEITKDVFFCSVMFYMRPEFRRHTKQFIKELELSLLPTEVTRLVIGMPGFKDHEKTERFLKMNGFKLLEKHFYKEV